MWIADDLVEPGYDLVGSSNFDESQSLMQKGPNGTLCSSGAPGEIRTPDRLVRSQVLYPAELRARGAQIIQK